MSDPAALIADLHGLAALAVAGLLALVGVAAAAAALGAGVSRRLVDRLLLGYLVAIAVAVLLGPALLVAGRAPADPLHLVYAAVALGALPVTRVLGARPRTVRVASARSASPSPGTDAGPPTARRGSVGTRLGRWLLLGGVVTLGSLLRLWMTGP